MKKGSQKCFRGRSTLSESSCSRNILNKSRRQPTEEAQSLSETGILTNLQPRPACEIWTRKQWIALALHLHNGNPPNQWVMGFFAPDFKNGGRPDVQYRRAKKTHFIGISWAWQSMCGKGKMKIAFTPYSQNNDEKSRWAGGDFDAHGDDPQCKENAQRMAFGFFKSVLNLEGIHVILEASGRGWHVFLISKEFRSVTEWYSLISSKLKDLGIEDQIEQGSIEVFPRPSTNQAPCGFALRAPGSWSPKTSKVSLILWEDVTPLLDELVTLNKETHNTVTQKRKKFLSLGSSLSSEEIDFFLYPRLIPLLDVLSIKHPQTRHKRLEKLAGELFHQVGEGMAERFILEQFRQKGVDTVATEEAHLNEFGTLWAGLHRRWLSNLSKSEAACFESLEIDSDKDAFRIIRSYAKNAKMEKVKDFAIARDDLGARLGITGAGASKLIQRFLSRKIIARVRDYVAHQFAARYVWNPKSS